jgi:hypothetical protein
LKFKLNQKINCKDVFLVLISPSYISRDFACIEVLSVFKQQPHILPHAELSLDLMYMLDAIIGFAYWR